MVRSKKVLPAKHDQLGHPETEASKLADVEHAYDGIVCFDHEKFTALEDYMMRYGQITENTMIRNEKKAKYMAELRAQVYGDVQCLLNEYRTFTNIRDEYLSELKERVYFDKKPGDSRSAMINGNYMPFEKLAEELDLMDTEAENRTYQKTYRPFIEVGRRLDMALSAVDNGIRRMKNRDFADLILYIYIDGRERPSMTQTLEHFGLKKNTYYKVKTQAITELTMMIFGPSNRECRKKKAELRGIIAELRYESDEDMFFESCEDILTGQALVADI